MEQVSSTEIRAGRGAGAAGVTDGIVDSVEVATFMRDRPVSCRWVGGELTGDPALLARLSHMILPARWLEDPSSVASAISAAVAHPVTIRVVPLDPAADAPVHGTGEDGPEPGPAIDLRAPREDRDDGDVLGDYWLG